MFFGRNQNKIEDVAAAAVKANSLATRSEEEGWEVVKATQRGNSPPPSPSSEKTIMTTAEVIPDDASAKSEHTVSEVSKDRVVVSTSQEGIETSTLSFGHGSIVDDSNDGQGFLINVSPAMPEWMSTMDYDQLIVNGAKGYYVVKRNLKTVALLFLLGVFCLNNIPTSKRERVPSLLMNDDKQQELIEYDLLIEKLRAKIEQLEESNRQTARELSMKTLERNHWRTRAVGCDQDLREVSSSHAKLEEEVKQSKWLAPVAFVTSPAPPRPNATAIADSPYIDEDHRTPSPARPRRIPYPQLALPEPDPAQLHPKPSMKMGRANQFSGIVLAPSVAVTAL